MMIFPSTMRRMTDLEESIEMIMGGKKWWIQHGTRETPNHIKEIKIMIGKTIDIIWDKIKTEEHKTTEEIKMNSEGKGTKDSMMKMTDTQDKMSEDNNNKEIQEIEIKDRSLTIRVMTETTKGKENNLMIHLIDRTTILGIRAL